MSTVSRLKNRYMTTGEKVPMEGVEGVELQTSSTGADEGGVNVFLTYADGTVVVGD